MPKVRVSEDGDSGTYWTGQWGTEVELTDDQLRIVRDAEAAFEAAQAILGEAYQAAQKVLLERANAAAAERAKTEPQKVRVKLDGGLMSGRIVEVPARAKGIYLPVLRQTTLTAAFVGVGATSIGDDAPSFLGVFYAPAGRVDVEGLPVWSYRAGGSQSSLG